MVQLAQGRAKVSRKSRWKARDLAILVLAGQQGLRVGEIAALSMDSDSRTWGGAVWSDRRVDWPSSAPYPDDLGKTPPQQKLPVQIASTVRRPVVQNETSCTERDELYRTRRVVQNEASCTQRSELYRTKQVVHPRSAGGKSQVPVATNPGTVCKLFRREVLCSGTLGIEGASPPIRR